MLLRNLLLAGALALAGAGLGAEAEAEAKDWKAVTIGMEGGYEPWNMTDPSGALTGFEPELAKDLCARMKVECKLITQDWDGMIAGLGAGKFDVIMDALSITPERQQVIAFSIPYAVTPAVFVASKSGGSANLPGTGTTIKLTGAPSEKPMLDGLRTALKGKTIGLQTATVYAKWIYDNFQDVATIREYKTSAEHDLDVLAGRIDVAFDDATYFSSALAKPENADLVVSGPDVAGSVWGDGEAIGLRKSDPELKTMFDTALKAALADGTVKKLSLKWFKIDVAP